MKYSKPEIEVITFKADIITTSPGGNETEIDPFNLDPDKALK